MHAIDQDSVLFQHAKRVSKCEQVLVYGDCAVNVEPSAEELALIAVTSAETAAAFGVTPRVAMLSYSTGVSGSGPQVSTCCGCCCCVDDTYLHACSPPCKVAALCWRKCKIVFVCETKILLY